MATTERGRELSPQKPGLYQFFYDRIQQDGSPITHDGKVLPVRQAHYIDDEYPIHRLQVLYIETPLPADQLPDAAQAFAHTPDHFKFPLIGIRDWRRARETRVFRWDSREPEPDTILAPNGELYRFRNTLVLDQNGNIARYEDSKLLAKGNPRNIISPEYDLEDRYRMAVFASTMPTKKNRMIEPVEKFDRMQLVKIMNKFERREFTYYPKP